MTDHEALEAVRAAADRYGRSQERAVQECIAYIASCYQDASAFRAMVAASHAAADSYHAAFDAADALAAEGDALDAELTAVALGVSLTSASAVGAMRGIGGLAHAAQAILGGGGPVSDIDAALAKWTEPKQDT